MRYFRVGFSIGLRAVLNFPSTKKANPHDPSLHREDEKPAYYAKRSSNASLFATENLKSIYVITTNETTTKETRHLNPVPIA
jgi:hypothetical protein